MFDDDLARFTRSTYRSLPRMALDLAGWLVLATLADHTGSALVRGLAVLAIGATAGHDLLFHAHEGAHRHLSRVRWVNEAASTAVHALFGLSGAGYRAFHLAHHRFAHTERDPELRLARGLDRQAPGLVWLALPLAGALATVAPLFRPGPLRARVARDVAVVGLLHGALLAALGPTGWATWVLAPLCVTGLAAALRGLCEHHGLPSGDRWTNTRGMEMGPVLGFLWSNAGYHVEHHLFPGVPYHHLPAVRAHLLDAYVAHGTALEAGYVRTALRLLRSPGPFVRSRAHAPRPRPLVNRADPAFRLRVALFRDVLRAPEARVHLLRVYHTGEAYTELHPDGLFAGRLPPALGRRLDAHLADEARHAERFRALLARDGAAPAPVAPMEDVGWHGLTSAVPEVKTTEGAFPRALVIRYFAFLHALELRSTSDLFALCAAADAERDQALGDAVRAIVKDEHRHAAYTLTAVHRLAGSPTEARRVLREVLDAERAAYRRSTAAILGALAERGAPLTSRAARVRWGLLRGLLALGLGTPRLPVYDRIPHPLAA